MPAPEVPTPRKYVTPHMVEALEHHALDEVTPPGSPVRSFYLMDADFGMQGSTLLTFTPEGIIIQGDRRPGENGVVSSKDYTLDWFCGDLAEPDVCEAFLQKAWQPTVAVEDARALLRTRTFDATTTLCLDLMLAQVEDGVLDEAQLRERLLPYGFSRAEVDAVGHDYPLGDAGWLCAIQQKFASLRRQVS